MAAPAPAPGSSMSSSKSPEIQSVKAFPRVSYIDSATAKKVDELLMAQPGFSLDQLMELAGLSVASAVHQFFTEDLDKASVTPSKKVLVVCGPGNNGGDGLVASRHLSLFGYAPTVVYPKPNNQFDNLMFQCQQLNIDVLSSLSAGNADTEEVNFESVLEAMNAFDVVVDAVFGFSFHGSVRKPFDAYVEAFARSTAPVLSVDVPSGWNVEQGDEQNTGFVPAAVVSLSFPKLCMSNYGGKHFLGGR
jgi:NAD(P)H-hydrate epimerase